MSDENVEIVRRLTDAINFGTVPREPVTEAPVDLRRATVFWFRGRRVACAVGYNTRRAALQAVGLSE
jgi:hypothetical protein